MVADEPGEPIEEEGKDRLVSGSKKTSGPGREAPGPGGKEFYQQQPPTASDGRLMVGLQAH